MRPDKLKPNFIGIVFDTMENIAEGITLEVCIIMGGKEVKKENLNFLETHKVKKHTVKQINVFIERLTQILSLIYLQKLREILITTQ